MTTATAEQAGAGPAGGRALGWWGTILLMMTEGMLFALLLFAYYYLRGQASEWPLGGIEPPELRVSAIRTALLLASSATMSWADRGIRKGSQGRLQLGIAATLLLSGVFLAGHVHEMLRLPEEFTWRTNAYGSLYYTITNFHAVHLVVGMAVLVFVLVAARGGSFDAEEHLGVTTASLYWHFVDVVWVFVYTTVYLVPNFW